MIKYYKEYQKKFEWKYEAQDFIKTLKLKARKSKLKIVVKILPEVRSISSKRASEARIIGYVVRWYYKP